MGSDIKLGLANAAADALKMLDILREDHGVGEFLPPGTKEMYEDVSENLREALSADALEVLNTLRETFAKEDAFAEHLEHASKVVRGWPEWRQNILGGTKGRDDGQNEGC